MNKYAYIVMVLFFAPVSLFCQTNFVPAPTKMPLSSVERISMPEVDNEQLTTEELALRAPGRAPQFATAFKVDLTPKNSGNWETLADGQAVWRLKVYSKGAYSINLGFADFYMPDGGHMILYTPRTKEVLGPFTPSDNEAHSQLWTPIVEGEELVIEVVIPISKKNQIQLHLTSVNHDFMNLAGALSGRCNLDVVCGAEDGYRINEQYRDVIQSVALYGFGGTGLCSGFLINNTENNCRPFFMTAAHCSITGGNAPSIVVYWNYQNSTCRQVGSAQSGSFGNGSLQNFNTGSILLSKYVPSDMTLLELDDEIPQDANAFFAGWDNRRNIPTDTMLAVHHPGAQEKRISYAFSDGSFAFWDPGEDPNPSANGDHIIVSRWDIGTTEDGSSGAPLFDKNKRIIGQLDGGAASCDLRAFDAFGAFTSSYTGGGTIGTSLVNYLDPINSGLEYIDGRWNNACSFIISPDILEQSLCAPGSVQFNFQLGDNFPSAINLTLASLPDGFNATFEQNPVNPGDIAQLTISASEIVEPGNYPFQINAESGGGTATANTTVFIKVSTDVAKTTSLIFPENLSMGLVNQIKFEWEDNKDELSTYEIQISQDSTFNNLELDQRGLATNSFKYEVQPNTQYFWRVRIYNLCGPSTWTPASRFSTANIICNNLTYTGDVIPISNREEVTVEAEINVRAPGTVLEVKLSNLDIEHSYVGDISVRLISPSGTEILLFDRPGVPNSGFGCSGSDLDVSFSDGAQFSSSQFENTCDNAPAITGIFRPVTPFSTLLNEPAQGIWILQVTDASNQDGGQLNGWQLDICTILPEGINLSTSQSYAEICEEEMVVFDFLVGTDFDSSGISLEINGVPEGVDASFSTNPALPGQSVQLSINGAFDPGIYPLEVVAQDSFFTYSLPLTVGAVSFPESPTLIFPGQNQLVSRSSTSFTWAPTQSTNRFNLLVFSDPTATDTLVNLISNTNTVELDTPLEPGEYTWQVIAQNACGMNSSELITYTLSTSSSNNPTLPSVSIYPNPSSNYFTVDLGAKIIKTVNWKIRAINGRLIDSGIEGNANIWTINTGKLESGLYLLELTSDDFVLIERIIKN